MALEDTIINDGKNTQSSIWDALVAAYSSSKAVKIGLMSLNYSYAFAAASLGFYAIARSIGTSVKVASKIITFRYNRLKQIYNDVKDTFNPFGKVKRSTLIGGTLGSVGYITGF